MEFTTHRARVTAPICYRLGSGRKRNIPVGPCLVERRSADEVDIIWGAQGQHAAALPFGDISVACDEGALVLLD